MKALLLNSGIGSRMGELTKSSPKCLLQISEKETILSQQVKMLSHCGIHELVITTGPFSKLLENYHFPETLNVTYVHNALFDQTNYIYSMHCAKAFLEDDLILIHGDLVFKQEVLEDLLMSDKKNAAIISTTKALPQKDFKAVVYKNRIAKIGVEFFKDAFYAQPLYRLSRELMVQWLLKIEEYCKKGKTACYAENALNELLTKFTLNACDIKEKFCMEIDTLDDLETVKTYYKEE